MKLTVVCVSNEHLDCPSKLVHYQEACHMHKSISLAQFLCMFLTPPQFHNNSFITLKNLFIPNIHRKIHPSSSFIATISPHFKIYIFNIQLSGYIYRFSAQKMCLVHSERFLERMLSETFVFTWYAREVQMWFTSILFKPHITLTIKPLSIQVIWCTLNIALWNGTQEVKDPGWLSWP